MKSSLLFLIFAFQSAIAAAAAPAVDIKDPRTALGREDDIRVDAQLLKDEISPGSIIGVTYQIQNLTTEAVAVAEKACSSSYDPDSQTVTVAIGSEIPDGGFLPKLTMIAAGESKTFTAGASLRVVSAAGRTRMIGIPRLVQIKVSVLRHLAPFAALLKAQAVRARLSDQQFDAWLESSDTIVLNPVPVRFNPERAGITAEAGSRASRY